MLFRSIIMPLLSQQRPHVPQFGNWDSGDNVPYTVFFDKARKNKTGGKMVNPNNPEENPDMFPNAAPSRTRPAPEEPVRRGPVKPAQDPRVSREVGDLRQFVDSPARHDNTAGKTDSSSSTHHRQGGRGSNSGRPSRHSASSEHSIERSPLHPHHQARIAGRGSGSPAQDGKNSYDSSHGTPIRSRLRPARSESVSPSFSSYPANVD